MAEKIIFDCDNTLGVLFNEVDDGLAILYLLGTPGIEILGITTTFGNGPIERVYSQTQKLIDRLGLKIPVLKGEDKNKPGQATPASNFLVEQVNLHPGEITLLATGPVGNLHRAAQEDPEFFTNLKRIVLMGGYLQPFRLGYRNLKELNFSARPEAARNVLSAHCPVTVFPAQACLTAPYRLRDIRRANYWPQWIKRTLIQWLITFSLFTGDNVFYLWDLLPAVYLSKPDLFNLHSFKFGSSLSDIEKGMLVEAISKSAPEITMARGITEQTAFFAELERGWRQAAEDLPL